MNKKILICTLTLLACGLASAQGQEKEPYADRITRGWSLSFNPADILLNGNLSFDTQHMLGRHWAAELSVRVNPWPLYYISVPQVSLTVNPNAVYWFFYPQCEWWLSVGAQYVYRANISSLNTSSWNDIGVSAAAGYCLMIHKHWNLNFGLGGWIGYETTVSEYPTWRRFKPSRTSPFFMEWDRVIVGVTYLF